MSKKKRIAFNLFIFAVLLMVFMTLQGAAFTAEGALNKQERTRNYGPSVTAAVIKHDSKIFFLNKYRNFYSCAAAKRGFLGFWYESKAGHAHGMENDLQKVVNYNMTGKQDKDGKIDTLYVYGIINNEKITSLEVEVLLKDSQGEMLTQKVIATITAAYVNNNETAGAETAEVKDTPVLEMEPGDSGVIIKDMFFAVIEQPGTSFYTYHKLAAFDQAGDLVYEESM